MHDDTVTPDEQFQPVEQTTLALQSALADYHDVDLTWIQPPPTVTGSSLALDALQFITRLIAHLQPRHIVEFGSGLSTRVMARACAKLDQPCCITSIDNDPTYSRIAREAVLSEQLDWSTHFYIAPLVARVEPRAGEDLLPMYRLERRRFATSEPADLILIDGPPMVLGGREGVLYQAMEFSRAGTLMLLDDASRDAEIATIARWQERLGEDIRVSVLPGFVKGLAAITLVRSPER